MSDRYQGYIPTSSGRSPTFNPARASMPTSVGYSSMYAGDMHVVPTASHRHYTTPKGYSSSTAGSGVPTTARTFAVPQDPRASSKTRDDSRTRRSTLDSASRPPVIITTTELDRPHGSSSHSANLRSGSPIRHEYRASDGQFYSQPASSSRSRSAARPYHASSPSEDYGRYRDRAETHLTSRDLEAYRNSRPSVVYPSDPRHSTAAIDYGDDGYEYTNVGELVKYDLDHSTKPSRSRRHERHESFDGGYYRPNVNYDLDRRNFNVNTSHDLNRNSGGTSRQHEGRSGPPPSTRGFDKINRTYDTRDVPPAAPVPPSPTAVASQLDVPGSSVGGRRQRPLSLYQDGRPRSSHHDDFYQSREDERTMRDIRDRERDWDLGRRPDHPRYFDNSVASRGFGIRTDLMDPPEDGKERRRDTRLDDPRKRSDEEVSDKDRDNRRTRQDLVGDRSGWNQTKRELDESTQDQDRSRTHETLVTGLGAVATAAGLAASSNAADSKEQRSPGPKRRRSPAEELEIGREEIMGQDAHPSFGKASQSMRETEPAREQDPIRERPQPPERETASPKDLVRGSDPIHEREPMRERASVSPRQSLEEPAREPAKENSREKEHARDEIRDDSSFERRRPGAESRTTEGDPTRLSSSDSDDVKKSTRRGRDAPTFNPNDASDLKQLKEQLASMELSDRRQEKEPGRPGQTDKIRPRSPSPRKERVSAGSSRDSSEGRHFEESRGRELVVAEPDATQMRLVSPPRERSDGKPLKGILKQPKPSFPEEANPIREGVAPHKEDKKLKEVPPGARWTKINRKIVNPEALTIGKERFELRDDFVIVLRVLSKEEIQAYAAATQVLRERRRNKHEGDKEGVDSDRGEREGERDDVVKEEGERRHRQRRRRDSDEDETGDNGRTTKRERERDRDREKDRDRDRDQRERERERDRPRERDRDRERERDRDRDRDRDYEREGDRRRPHRRDETDDYEGRPRDDHRHHHHHNHRSFRDRERELEA